MEVAHGFCRRSGGRIAEVAGSSDDGRGRSRFVPFGEAGASAAVRTQTISGLSLAVDNSLRHYAVRGYWSGAGATNEHKLGAVRIDYTIATLLP